ncbi:MAG TPA: MDR family MFS transporter [Candidatus Methylacidiphilales bacterium]|nr:MDR family MFS transporter [Candidatus Methylacidiphilales bacterium]
MTTPPRPTDAPVSRRELYTVFAGLMLALALASLDQNIVSTALPRIVSDLGGLAHLSWVVTAFMVTSTSTAPLYGKLSDMYGRKRLFFTAIIIFLIGSILCGTAQTMLQLIVFRAIQGLGAGGLITLAQTTVGDLIAPRERGRYQGLFGAVFAACSVAGPLLGGVITDTLSWRWIFYVNLPVGAAALCLIAVGLRHHCRSVTHRIDYAGAGLLTCGTVSLLLLLSWGGVVYPWFSPAILALACAVPLFYGLLAVEECRAAEPILPPRLFRNPVFTISVSVTGLNAMALFGSLVFLPLFFQLVLGASPSHAGLMMAPMMGGVIAASVAGGRLVSATGRYKIFPILGLIAGFCGFCTLAWAARADASLAVIEAALVLLGCGLGLVMPNLTVALQNSVERSDMGVATSVTAFIRSLGGALGVAVAGAVVAFRLRCKLPPEWTTPGVGRPSLLEMGVQQISQIPGAQHAVLLNAYRHAIATTFLTGAGVAALAFVIALFLPERPLRGSIAAPERAEY